MRVWQESGRAHKCVRGGTRGTVWVSEGAGMARTPRNS